jgi:hypothetical protein
MSLVGVPDKLTKLENRKIYVIQHLSLDRHFCLCLVRDTQFFFEYQLLK